MWGKTRFLFTMLRMDFVPGPMAAKHLLKKQSLSVNIPLVTRSVSEADYEKVFMDQLSRFKVQGIKIGVFAGIVFDDLIFQYPVEIRIDKEFSFIAHRLKYWL